MTNQRTDLDHGSPVFWSAPFAAVGNLPTGWHWLGIDWMPYEADMLACRNGCGRWLRSLADYADRDAEPVDVHPQRPEVPPPAAEAAVGEPVGSGCVPAGQAEDGLDGHQRKGSPRLRALHDERHRLQRCRRLGEPFSARRLREVRCEIDMLEMAEEIFAGVGPNGEWPEGLVGVALKVGADRSPWGDPSEGWTAVDPWADVATQHHGVVRVPLVRPVARLEEVWSTDVLVKEESDGE